MKAVLIYFIASIVSVLFCMVCGCSNDNSNYQYGQLYDKTPKDSTIAIPKQSTKDTLPVPVRILQKVYPNIDIEYGHNILTVNGEEIVYDDMKDKGFIEMLDNCDVEDMFSRPYDTSEARPTYLSDAGRGRCEAFFKAMYGHTEKEVSRNLVIVNWFGQKLRFTRINGADKQLKKVEQELQGRPTLHKYFAQSSTFYWRKVRGANRQSAHSYGMTIDINVANSDYWQWANPGKGELDKIAYKNRIPIEIVEVFEKYGFIWGGRWYHYDTMHFEYRPELLQ